MQQELRFWARDCVRQVLLDYLTMRSRQITEETRTDYRTRLEWLCEVLGPSTTTTAVDFNVLEAVTNSALVVLAPRTVRMRLQFWAGAVEYAELRGVVPTGRPKLPPWLSGATKPMDDYYTGPQFREFRLGLPTDNGLRDFADQGFWTGMHTLDLEASERWMFEPDHVWEGSAQRGRWWRRNNKSKKKIPPAWVPMEPELRELALGWLARRGGPHDRICGPVHNKSKYFDLAAERAGLRRIRPNLGLRSSHSTLLLSRGYTWEYVRLVMGHRGEMRGHERPDGTVRAVTIRPSVLTGHYARATPETLRPQR